MSIGADSTRNNHRGTVDRAGNVVAAVTDLFCMFIWDHISQLGASVFKNQNDASQM